MIRFAALPGTSFDHLASKTVASSFARCGRTYVNENHGLGKNDLTAARTRLSLLVLSTDCLLWVCGSVVFTHSLILLSHSLIVL